MKLKHLINKPYRRRYHFFSIAPISFFIIVVLSSSTLLVSFLIYRNDLKAKTLTIEQERLSSYAEQIDAQYNRVLMSVNQLALDNHVREWFFGRDGCNSNLYLLRLVMNKMNYLTVLNNLILSFEIYNDKTSEVVSNYDGYYNSIHLENHFTEPRKIVYTNFMSSKNIKQATVAMVKKNNAFIDVIMLLNSIPTYKKRGAIGALIEIDKLLSMINDKNVAIVYNKNPLIYFCSDNFTDDKDDLDLSELMSKLIGNGEGVYTFGVNGKVYYVAHKNIISNQFKLVRIIPETELSVNFYVFYEYFRVAFVLVIMLSILSSFLIYKLFHKSIRSTIDNISRKISGIFFNNKNFSDDLEYSGTYDEIIIKNSEFEKALLNYRRLLKEKVLRDLIYGKRDDDISLFAFTDYIDAKMRNFITLIFDIDSQMGERVSYLLDSFEMLICEELAKKYKANYLRTGFMQYTMLITLQNLAEREALIKDIRQLQESIQSKYGASFTVGVSTVKQNLDDIHICYDEACEAIKYKNIYAGKKIIDILDIKSEDRTCNSFPIYEAQMLVKKLRTSSEEEIVETVEKMIGKQKNQYSMELLNAFLLYLSFCIGQVGIEYNISPEAIFDSTFLQFITEYDNIEKKKEYLLAQCKKILEARSCEQRRYKKLSAEIAIKYIQENYDKPISLDILAYELNMSSSYLSRLIKEEIGQNFNTYLNKLRIDKAIELLQKGNLTNDEIAQKVGYENQHTFIRNFKKFTGKTPGSYKG